MSPTPAKNPEPTTNPQPAANLPRLGMRGTGRWIWRQLTSMRVALMLLMLLAVVAVPGSILPQRPQNPAKVATWIADNPGLGSTLDRLGFFDVYASVWFSAVYLLLFISLAGCILPRVIAHTRAWKAAPPRAPRRFDRFEVHHSWTTPASADHVVDAAHATLRAGRRFRVVDGADGTGRTVSAERGYLRETGNIVFHLALIGLLIAVATGQLFGYRGQVLLIEGDGFANTPASYDTFSAGSAVSASDLVPFVLTLNSFTARFDDNGDPVFFQADVALTEPGGSVRDEAIRVNRPLETDGAKVYLAGNGYAPQITVADASGTVAFAGRVPFLPQDASYRSRGVIKVPDVTGAAAGADQIGLVGYLLPTAVITDDAAYSAFPQPGNPVLVLQVWRGDLGLDSGVPQNVYELDSAQMTQVTGADGTPATVTVPLGQTVELPDGLGTIRMDDVPRYVALDLRHDPALGWILTSALAALLGLAVSLFTPRRRVWLRVADDGNVRRVEVAGLARSDDGGLAGEVDRVVEAVSGLSGRPDMSASGPEPNGGSGPREPS